MSEAVVVLVVWQYSGEEKTALKIVRNASVEDEAKLNLEYPTPEYEVQWFSSAPDSFENDWDIKEGATYHIGYDPFETPADWTE